MIYNKTTQKEGNLDRTNNRLISRNNPNFAGNVTTFIPSFNLTLKELKLCLFTNIKLGLDDEAEIYTEI